MVFHEITLYKGKSGDSTDATDTVSKNLEFVSLDILEFTPQDQPIDMGIPVVPQDGARPSTPPTILCRSTRFVKAIDWYLPLLDYILLIDSVERKSYKKALQDENLSKWELTMKDEMDSLLGNQI